MSGILIFGCSDCRCKNFLQSKANPDKFRDLAIGGRHISGNRML